MPSGRPKKKKNESVPKKRSSTRSTKGVNAKYPKSVVRNVQEADDDTGPESDTGQSLVNKPSVSHNAASQNAELKTMITELVQQALQEHTSKAANHEPTTSNRKRKQDKVVTDSDSEDSESDTSKQNEKSKKKKKSDVTVTSDSDSDIPTEPPPPSLQKFGMASGPNSY